MDSAFRGRGSFAVGHDITTSHSGLVEQSTTTIRPKANSRRLNVLWLSHFLPYPAQGGALQRSHHLLRQAASRHAVHLVSLNQRAILPDGPAIREAAEYLQQFCTSITVFDMP